MAIVTFRFPPYEELAPVGHAGPELCVHVKALKLALVPLDMLAWQSGEANEHWPRETRAWDTTRVIVTRALSHNLPAEGIFIVVWEPQMYAEYTVSRFSVTGR